MAAPPILESYLLLLGGPTFHPLHRVSWATSAVFEVSPRYRQGRVAVREKDSRYRYGRTRQHGRRGPSFLQ